MVNPRLRHKLYTFGYQGRQISELVRFATELEALVMDTRLNAYSPRPDFKAHKLKEVLGDQYVNMGKYLGNVNYKNGGPIELADREGGIQMVAAAVESNRTAIVLMCGCKDVETCHRTWIAIQVAELTGVEVEHL